LDGDKLHSLINPTAIEPRVKKLESTVRSLSQVLAATDSGGGTNPNNPNVPIIDPELITVTVVKQFSSDRVYQPGVTVAVDPQYEGFAGFDGYDYQFTNGGFTTQLSNVAVDLGRAAVTSFQARNLPGPTSQTVPDAWTVQARCRNSIYGPGDWSTPKSFNIAPSSTIAPGGRSNALSGTGANTVQVTFTLPDPVDLPNYLTTEIWIGTTTTFDELTGTLLGTNNKGVFQFTPDLFGALSGQNTLYIRIRDVDTTGTPSPFGAATQLSSTEIDEAQHYPIGFGTDIYGDIKLATDVHGDTGVIVDAHALVGGNSVPFEVDTSGNAILHSRFGKVELMQAHGVVISPTASGETEPALTVDNTGQNGPQVVVGNDLLIDNAGDVVIGNAIRPNFMPAGLLWMPGISESPTTPNGAFGSTPYSAYGAPICVKMVSGKVIVYWSGAWYQLGQALGDNDVENVLDDGHSPIVVDNTDPANPVIGHDVSGVTSGPYVLTSITIDDYGHATVIGSGSVTGTAPITVDNTDPANPIVTHDDTSVGPGTYSLGTITVDQKGHLTDAQIGLLSVDIDHTVSPYAFDPAVTSYLTCDTTGGAITVNMPDANSTSNGCVAIISNMGSSIDVTIAAAGGDNIDGRGSNVVKAGCTSIYVSYSGAAPWRGWHSAGFDMLLGQNNLADVTVPATARANLGLGTAAIKNVPASGNASTSEVVKGDDTRLTDSRTPTAHASTHLPSGGDALTTATPADLGNANAAGTANSLVRSDHVHKRTVRVKSSGTDVGTRNAINFDSGFSLADNSGSDRVDVSLAAIQKYDTIQDEGSALTQRAKANFTGNGVSAADDAGNTATKIVVPGISTGTYAATRTGEVAGELYLPSDGIIAERFDGSIHSPWGPILPLSAPLDPASWTWDNQISGTTTDTTRGGVILNCTTTASTSIHTKYKTANSTPWSWIVGFFSHGAINNSMGAGIALRDSAGKIIFVQWTMNGNFQVDRWTNSTTFSANSKTDGMGLGATFGPHFLKVLDDGTNLKYYMSFDWGQHWTQRFSESRTAFFASGPTQVGYAVNNANNSEPLSAWYFHLKEGTS
jgi:hypothetical protein